MRNVIIFTGAVAGLAATVPGFLQNHPQMVSALFTPQAAPVPPPQAKVATLSAPAAPEQPLTGHKVRLAADRRGHFDAEFELNGYSVPALVDTGATYVALNSSTARRIGIHLASADYRYSVTTANGIARAAGAMIGSLDIGRIHMENVQALVLDDDALSGTLIGMSFLKRLSKYEVTDGQLLLEQ